MSRSISFTPSSHPPDPSELTYVEQTSRHRSIYALLHDTGPSRTASRERFLRNAYREIVTRYMSMGKIEHPVPLLRGVIAYLDALSTRVDSRVTDFDGLHLYVLVQDGNTGYLLASRGTGTHLRRSGKYVALGANHVTGVRELPVESVASQQELFSKSIPDFLVLYRIEFEEPDEAGLSVILGGNIEESKVVAEMLQSPAGVGASPKERIPVSTLRQTVLYVAIDRALPTRLEPLAPARKRFTVTRLGNNVLAAVSAVLLLGSLAAVWITQWAGGETTVAKSPVADGGTGEGASEAPARLRESQTPVAAEVAAEPAPERAEGNDVRRVELTVAWKKEYAKPVTSSPSIRDDVVLFGGRDGNVYALDRSAGGVKWRHEAGAGIGSSPLLVGNYVVVCDYNGGVTALDRRTGKPAWTRSLPEKIVSTPSAAGGEILVGSMNGIAYSLSLETGRILWEFKTRGAVRASIAADDERFYVPSYDGSIYAIQQGSGGVVWRYQTDGRVSASPAIGKEGIAVGTAGGEVVMLDAATGGVRWRFKARFAVGSFVRMQDGRVYAGTDGGDFYCLNAADGKLLWEFGAGASVFARPHITENHVFVASYDRFVYCLDARTGAELGRFDAGASVYSSPTGVEDTIYFGNNEGVFYCLRLAEKRAS